MCELLEPGWRAVCACLYGKYVSPWLDLSNLFAGEENEPQPLFPVSYRRDAFSTLKFKSQKGWMDSFRVERYCS